MSKPLSVLIVDDDRFASAMLRARWLQSMPEAEVSMRESADVSGAFDVYVIDNQFDGSERGVELARRARGQSPGSLVVAFSSSLDGESVAGLVEAGCDAVAEKSNGEDRELVFELARRYRNARRDAGVDRDRDEGAWRAAAVPLLRLWNRRLEHAARTAESA